MVTFLYFIFTESDDRVRLTDVSTLTLVKGQYTTGRRSAPVLQLQCVGGSAKGRYEPRVHFFNLAI
uniref:Store-operated calcium entry-associated regulatory factor n=1 Tax=Ascaris lumbricoides TaxID=6252 RepID=A0A0M3IWK6_ASCLU